MWTLGTRQDLRNSGWTLVKKEQILSPDGNPYNTYVDVTTGIKIFYVPKRKSVKRSADGSHKTYDGEAVISKYEVSGYTVNSHNMYLRHPNKGLYKVIAFDDYSDMPHFWTYYVYLKGEEIQ